MSRTLPLIFLFAILLTWLARSADCQDLTISKPATEVDDVIYGANADAWVKQHRAYERTVMGRIMEQAFSANNFDPDTLIRDLTLFQNQYRSRESLAGSPAGYQAYSPDELHKTELLFDIAAVIPGLKDVASLAHKQFEHDLSKLNTSQGAIAQIAARAQQTDILAQSQIGDDHLWFRLKQMANHSQPMAAVLDHFMALDIGAKVNYNAAQIIKNNPAFHDSLTIKAINDAVRQNGTLTIEIETLKKAYKADMSALIKTALRENSWRRWIGGHSGRRGFVLMADLG